MAGVVVGRPADSWRAEARQWKTLFSRFPGSSGFDVNEVLPVRGAALRRGCGATARVAGRMCACCGGLCPGPCGSGAARGGRGFAFSRQLPEPAAPFMARPHGLDLGVIPGLGFLR